MSVLRERSAAARARCDAMWYAGGGTSQWHWPFEDSKTQGKACVACERWAETYIALPQRQTVRYEPDPHLFTLRWHWSVGQTRWIGETGWWDSWCEVVPAYPPTLERIDLWQSLRARPFNLVDDDGTTP